MSFLISSRAALIASFICLVAATGCEQKEKIGAVKGTVTFEGKPVSEAVVQFSNAEKAVYISAPVSASGTYRVETASGVGLPLGKYAVAVVPPVPVLITGQTPPPPKDHDDIPTKYRDAKTSGLTVDVVSGSVDFNIDMKP